MQAVINTLHNNGKVISSTTGVVFANQSAPLLLDIREGGESVIVVSNYTVKHMKL
jgi:hypothetical protein